jgi:hypothetical protein
MAMDATEWAEFLEKGVENTADETAGTKYEL